MENADLGLLIIRLVLGITFMAHGAQKLFGWFGGYGPKGTGGWLESIGVKPGVAMAVLAGLSEFIGGLLLASGLFLLLSAILVTATMLVAISKVHAQNGYFVDKGGIEYPFIVIAIFIGIALIGPGAYSLEAILQS